MTSPEILRSELEAFVARRDAKFAEICTLLCEQRGQGESVSDEQRREIAREAQDQLETWRVKTEEPAHATPMERLFAEYCQMDAEIMKREDQLAAMEDALDVDDNDD
ncbi:MAG: hypothetical protein U1E67_20115 [Hyphomicrobiales bacterium]